MSSFQLRSITSIDIAEQALTALEMISKRNGKQILIAVRIHFSSASQQTCAFVLPRMVLVPVLNTSISSRLLLKINPLPLLPIVVCIS